MTNDSIRTAIRDAVLDGVSAEESDELDAIEHETLVATREAVMSRDAGLPDFETYRRVGRDGVLA